MKAIFLCGALAGSIALTPLAAFAQQPLPRIESANGKHLLMVDGEPFLMLGAQANNSSNYPAVLPQVWPMMERLHANTLEIPIAWEQFEPEEGRFDYSYLEALVEGARERNKRLVLLWFATWKNTGPSYAPLWVKTDIERFPRMRTAEGNAHYALSPHARSTLEADKRAFVELMRWLRDNDPQRTVIMVQPENEVGVYGQKRDHSAEAEKLFAGPIPAGLARHTGKSGSWREAFGPLADSAFNSWYTARYIDEIAAAGQEVLDLPMYANAALSDPFSPPGEGGGASGGPDMPVIDIWKAAAPHIDFVAPDIYMRDQQQVAEVMRLYARPDNALMIPEIGNAADYARFWWTALGHGAIGFAPFGMDDTGYSNYPLGAKELDEDTVEAFAAKYRLFAPMAGAWARVAARSPTWGAAKPSDGSSQSQRMGRWTAHVEYGEWQFGDRDSPWLKSDPHPTEGQPVGGAVFVQTGPDEFLVAGSNARVHLGLAEAAPGQSSAMLRVEEGTLAEDGSFVMRRVWNGDQTDHGLNFTSQPVLLKVTMGSYQ
ncbi:DUF5597 domain-containing protein [Croceicoccus marinus]|uniref:DUF5597 domain-containing protein n=1 Tax=Croceicoccus marinus TaxID=450378 RepID=A0A1Z1FGZ7_9SPHN|nr:DUF5597 domain-containing protein [Croceicoccus marinus]ARU18000.1 glycoside hydrolase [Croceicoccus marinus]QNE07506.1 DUF5597 domain-containing protein [Croceicoccus marinus]